MHKILISGFSFYQLLLFYFIYAFLGWVTEVIFATLKTGKFVNRGFLNGPLCPIYGVGVVLILICLEPIKSNLILLFLCSCILTSALEFITGFILSKCFHKKWWDYSKEPFNIGGYVCLRFSLLWGIACVFVIGMIHPPIEALVDKLPDLAGYIIIGILVAAFIVDLVFTALQLLKLNRRYKELDRITAALRIGSDAIGSRLSEATVKAVEGVDKLKAAIAHSRLVKAFPKLHPEKNIKDEAKKSDAENDAKAVLPNKEKLPEDDSADKPI